MKSYAYDIFISYSSKNRREVEPFVELYTDLGFRVFFDRQMSSGESWSHTISRALDSTKCILVFWSKESAVSIDGVIPEALSGQQKGILVHALLTDCQPPYPFNSVVMPDLRNKAPSHFDKDTQSLLEQIVGLTGRPHVLEWAQLRHNINTKKNLSESVEQLRLWLRNNKSDPCFETASSFLRQNEPKIERELLLIAKRTAKIQSKIAKEEADRLRAQSEREKLQRKLAEKERVRAGHSFLRRNLLRLVAIMLILSAGIGLTTAYNSIQGYEEAVCSNWMSKNARWEGAKCPWKSNFDAYQAAQAHVKSRERHAAERANEVYGATITPHDDTHLAAWYFEKVGCYDRNAYLSATLLRQHRVVFRECSAWVGR